MSTYAAGDPCPQCQKPMEELPGMFSLRETGPMPGIVCTPCNSLYNSKEFTEALALRARGEVDYTPPFKIDYIHATFDTRLPEKTFWLSFVGRVGGREKALGVVITDATDPTAALHKVSGLGLNPGGEAMIVEVPDEPEAQAEVAKFPKNTLLDPETLLAEGCIKNGDVGEYDPSKPPVTVSTVCEDCNTKS